MDGANLRRRVAELLNENETTSNLLVKRSTYDFLYDAAKNWVIKTECLTAEQTITTVASQSDYVLNADYLGLFLKRNDRFYAKYYDGSAYTFINFKPYTDVYYENQTTAISIPNYFTLLDYRSLYSQVTGAASANGASVGGKCLLTTATDKFDNVSAGDSINNTTDGSAGIVISKTDAKNIYVALFGGTANDISSADAFIIQPKGRMKLIFDPPPSTASHYCYVPYLQEPAPVYSDYDVYRINFDYTEAFANYAAWKYKYKDKSADFGDKFYAAYLAEVEKYNTQTDRVLARTNVSIIPRWK